MDESKQPDWPTPSGSARPEFPANPDPETWSDDSSAGDPPGPAELPPTRRVLLVWLGILVTLGLGGMLLGQQELALLAAFSGVFVAAHVADVDPQWRDLYRVLSWVTPTGGFMIAGALGFYLSRSDLPAPLRVALVLICAFTMGLSIALVAGPVADRAARTLLHAERPRHVLHLAARCVVIGLVLGVPVWFAAQDVLEQMMRESDSLLDKAGLGGGLIGYVLLAFAGAGWLVRRDLRGTLARLGLRVPRISDVVVAALAVGALWFLNSGGEWLQQRWFPASYAADRRMSDAIAAGMGPGRMLLLGLSAGIGEEVTMRGGLQPRLGIVLTSLLFASLHVQYSWFGILAIFALGSLLGLVRKTTSTTSAILAHVAYDVLALATH